MHCCLLLWDGGGWKHFLPCSKGTRRHSMQSKGTSYCGRVALMAAFANIQQLAKAWPVP